MKRNKLLARFIALNGVRNTELEELHLGTFPSTKNGDYSDVKVVSPFGEIKWNEVSRISDKEMRRLMLDIEKRIVIALDFIEKTEKEIGAEKLTEMIRKDLFEDNGTSWDVKR